MWTFPVPIPSRIPSTPWKTDTRTAGAGLPSFFPSCPHSAVRTTPAPCVTFSRSIPPDAPFLSASSHTGRQDAEAADRTGPPKTGRHAHERRQHPLCPPHRAGPAPPNAVAATAARKIPCPVPLPQYPCPVLLFPAPAAAAARFRPARPASPFRLEAAVPPC